MHTVQRRLHKQYGPIIRIAPNEISTAELSAIPKIYKHAKPLAKTDFYAVWGGGTISEQLDQFSETNERVYEPPMYELHVRHTLTSYTIIQS